MSNVRFKGVAPRRSIRGAPAPLLALISFAIALDSCGGKNPSDESDPSALAMFERLQKLDQDLAAGSQGEEVRAVQEYLARYGYFPNAALAREFPQWRPIVSDGPSRGDLYDTNTEAAVRAFQRFSGLTDTGIVDEPTRAILREPRCGVPEGIRPVDSADKFALEGSTWPITDLSWRYVSTGAPSTVSVLGARTAITAAFASWNARTNLTFTERAATDTTAKITVAWAAISNVAEAFFPSAGQGTIKFSTNSLWTLNGAVSGRFDYQTVMLHEIGHALGLNHSSVGTPSTTVMRTTPPSSSNRQLGSDDILAISTRYNPWVLVPGCVKDLAVGNDQSVWVIGCDNIAVKRNNDGTWSLTSPTQTGSSIAVDSSGKPWVVALNGQVVFRTSNSASSGQWTAVANTCVKDIGASSSIWATWCGGPDGVVVKWNGSGFNSESNQFTGKRIAVEQTGKPWIVRSDGTVFRRSSSSASSGSWERVRDGWFFGPDADIGVALSDTFVQAWVTDTIASPADLWVWNKQPGASGDMFNPPKNDWVKVPGHSNRVSVGPNNPWVAATSTGGISPMIKRPLHP